MIIDLQYPRKICEKCFASYYGALKIVLLNCYNLWEGHAFFVMATKVQPSIVKIWKKYILMRN